MSGSIKGAVFISYAREDTVAADRLAEALRSHGLEVWFDQNELAGGDAWDGKIRGQIRNCALLIPVVSANTQSRGEGYFRREWKLAAERTHDMAAGIAFLVPVVIDDTAEAAALVPEEFMRVQWTRLPQGRTTPQFAAQVKRLLEAPRGASQKSEISSQRPSSFAKATEDREAGVVRRREEPLQRGPAKWLLAAGVAVAIGLGTYFTLRPATRPTTAPMSSPPASSAAKPPLDFAPAKSIAVLPFANLSAEKDNEFFADGVHDDVITNLQKIRDLKVISRTSVLAYRDTAARNLTKIADDLGVATVLEGSVRRVGNQVRVNAKLIVARTEESLWADTLNGDASDIFALQATIAQKIAAALKATLTPSERTLIERRPTENQQAYELYLQARVLEQALTTRSTLARFEQVAAIYQRAVALDPAFALAYARLAVVHGQMYFLGHVDPTPDRRRRAEAAMNASRRLATGAPETRMAQGAFAYFCDNDWARSLLEYEAAEMGLPNDAQLQAIMGFAYRRLGKWVEAVRRLERAVALDPRDAYGSINLVQSLWVMRRYEQLQSMSAHYRERFPNDGFGLDLIGRAEFQLSGDRAAYLRARASLPFLDTDPDGLQAAFVQAMLADDYEAADRVLTDPRLTVLVSTGTTTLNEPVALHRALVAFVRGDQNAARTSADQAIAYYRSRRWTPRQEPWAQLGIARAEAYAGRVDEALRDARAAFAAVIARHDAFDSFIIQGEVGRLLAAMNQPAEALSTLRELMTGPCWWSPNEIRLDPLWSRLKDDPRFEEILKAAKPL